jgi:hypothetical protein
MYSSTISLTQVSNGWMVELPVTSNDILGVPGEALEQLASFINGRENSEDEIENIEKKARQSAKNSLANQKVDNISIHPSMGEALAFIKLSVLD